MDNLYAPCSSNGTLYFFALISLLSVHSRAQTFQLSAPVRHPNGYWWLSWVTFGKLADDPYVYPTRSTLFDERERGSTVFCELERRRHHPGRFPEILHDPSHNQSQ